MIDAVDRQDEDIIETALTILLPVSAESNLKTGLFSRLMQRRADEFAPFYNRFGKALPNTEDRLPLAENMNAVFDSDGRIIIWIVKNDKTEGCTDIEQRTARLINQCVRNGIDALAISRSAFRYIRMTNDDFDYMVELLSEGDIRAEVYQ